MAASRFYDFDHTQHPASIEHDFDSVSDLFASSPSTPANNGQLCSFPHPTELRYDEWSTSSTSTHETNAVDEVFNVGSWVDSPFDCAPDQFLSPLPSLNDEPNQADGITTYNEDDRMTCSKCNIRFENVYALDQHAKTSGHKTFKCPVIGCDRTYCRKDSWQRHKKTHDCVLTCYFCSGSMQKRSFRRRDHLRTHVRNCHPEVHLRPETTTPAAFVQQEVDESQRAQQLLSSSVMEREASSSGAFSDIDGARYESPAVRDLVPVMRKLLCDRDDILRAVDERLSLDPTSTTEQLARSIAKLVENYPPKGIAR